MRSAQPASLNCNVLTRTVAVATEVWLFASVALSCATHVRLPGGEAMSTSNCAPAPVVMLATTDDAVLVKAAPASPLAAGAHVMTHAYVQGGALLQSVPLASNVSAEPAAAVAGAPMHAVGASGASLACRQCQRRALVFRVRAKRFCIRACAHACLSLRLPRGQGLPPPERVQPAG